MTSNAINADAIMYSLLVFFFRGLVSARVPADLADLGRARPRRRLCFDSGNSYLRWSRSPVSL